MDETLKITQDEVSKVLEKRLKSNKFEIVDYKVNMLGEWVGLCGDHALLTVTVKPDEVLKLHETHFSFFVKLFPRVDLVVEFIEGTGAFRKEIFVYKLFDVFEDERVKTLRDCVAKCYLTVPRKYLIMEELIEQGYSPPNKHKVFDFDTVKVALEALSKLHASTLVYEEKKSCKLIDVYEEELEESYFTFGNKEGLEAAITGILNSLELFNFPEKLLSGKNFRTVLEEVCRRVFTLAKPSKTFRNVLCHGDIWATNMLVKRDGDKPIKCKLVDFQCARYTPPAQDVMSVIHLTTSPKFRKEYMNDLIEIYYSSLKQHVAFAGYDMEKILPFDMFLASCEEQKAFSLVQAAIYFPLILMRSDVAQFYFENKETNREALLVDRSLLVKEQMEKDDNYKNRIRDCIQDLKDYCDCL